MEHNCLNCKYQVIDHYCQNCGQKSSTHRYSIKHFVEHDFIHGVWHVDKGMLFTIKELFTRPGNGVREFIQGKRINYFSFVTLIIPLLYAYGTWYYFQFYSVYGYSKKALLFRSILVILSYSLFQAVLGFVWGLVQALQHKIV